MKRRLCEFAYARSGDKGAHANVGVWVHNEEDYAIIRGALTESVVERHFSSLHPQRVRRYDLPNLLALNFVLEGVLGEGGASVGLRTDAQAKVYSARLLQLEIEVGDD